MAPRLSARPLAVLEHFVELLIPPLGVGDIVP